MGLLETMFRYASLVPFDEFISLDTSDLRYAIFSRLF